ncbi:MAG: hypothetical protein QXS54_00990 [Candidatus Methanomethylicaceae archaeon]
MRRVLRELVLDLRTFYQAVQRYREVYWGSTEISVRPFTRMLFYGVLVILLFATGIPSLLIQQWQRVYTCYYKNSFFGIGEIIEVEERKIGDVPTPWESDHTLIAVYHREITYALQTKTGRVVGTITLPAFDGVAQRAAEWLGQLFSHSFFDKKNAGDFLLFTYNPGQPHTHCLYIAKLLSLFFPLVGTVLSLIIAVKLIYYAYQSRKMLWLMFRK